MSASIAPTVCQNVCQPTPVIPILANAGFILRLSTAPRSSGFWVLASRPSRCNIPGKCLRRRYHPLLSQTDDVTYNCVMTSAGHVSKQALPTQGVRLAVDMIPTLAWSACSDGGADFFNQRWLDYTGLSAEHARDWGWTAALHPDDLNGIADYWRSVFLSGEPGEIEGRLRRFDGEYRWCLFRASPSLDSDGRVVKWFGTNTDIEDRKRNEATLLENEERFRL